MSKINMLAGHSKLPQGMAAKSMYDSLTITVEVDKQYSVILDASCTLATEHAQKYIGRILRGSSLLNGLEPLLKDIRDSYHGKAQQALIAATKDLYNQYISLKPEDRHK